LRYPSSINLRVDFVLSKSPIISLKELSYHPSFPLKWDVNTKSLNVSPNEELAPNLNILLCSVIVPLLSIYTELALLEFLALDKNILSPIFHPSVF